MLLYTNTTTTTIGTHGASTGTDDEYDSGCDSSHYGTAGTGTGGRRRTDSSIDSTGEDSPWAVHCRSSAAAVAGGSLLPVVFAEGRSRGNSNSANGGSVDLFYTTTAAAVTTTASASGLPNNTAHKEETKLITNSSIEVSHSSSNGSLRLAPLHHPSNTAASTTTEGIGIANSESSKIPTPNKLQSELDDKDSSLQLDAQVVEYYDDDEVQNEGECSVGDEGDDEDSQEEDRVFEIPSVFEGGHRTMPAAVCMNSSSGKILKEGMPSVYI